ncbi:hypothetical protein EAT49_09050 [Histidinibacterium lentulum]|uniref:Uncharacterized protein n=1 Tax=Histidinibacterium lentulum TaxID=2480588 RepID=A0A3N2R4Z3_9RHOB|nr:hypothetical protein EAT49_09050 [Histidinibacterium lentulum]
MGRIAPPAVPRGGPIAGRARRVARGRPSGGESLHPGAEAIAAPDGEARAELYALIPELGAGRKRMTCR